MACILVAPCALSSAFEGACIDIQTFLLSSPKSRGVALKSIDGNSGNLSTIGIISGRELILLE